MVDTVVNPSHPPSPPSGSTLAIFQPLIDRLAWIKCLSILNYISAALSIVFSLGILIVVAWVPILLGIRLWRAAKSLEEGLDTGDQGFAAVLPNIASFFFIVSVWSLVSYALVALVWLAIGIATLSGAF